MKKVTRVQTQFKDKSKTQQHMEDDVNINKLVQRHGIGNIQIQDKPLQYMDISNVTSFHDMQSHVAKVSQGFNRLPSNVRTKFKNNVNKFVEYMADERNHPEAWKLGLIDDPDGLLEDAYVKIYEHKKEEPVIEAPPKDESTPVEEPAK